MCLLPLIIFVAENSHVSSVVAGSQSGAVVPSVFPSLFYVFLILHQHLTSNTILSQSFTHHLQINSNLGRNLKLKIKFNCYV